MDAKITKQRLSTLLSYDWLKILVTVAVAVFLVLLVFLISATRATNAQTFSVYAYTDLSAGEDFTSVADTLKKSDVFSYDILKTEAETFSSGTQVDQLSLRRSTGSGTVMFISDQAGYRTNDDGSYETDDNGDRIPVSELWSLTMGGAATAESDVGVVYDSKYWLDTMCKEYLVSFFGENLENAEPDAGKVRESFFARNGKDKRYKTAAAREAGVAEERERLVSLREDYLAVQELFEKGVYTHTMYEGKTSEGEVYQSYLGINVGRLTNLGDLVYYEGEDGVHETESINLVVFFNDFGAANGMLFEPVTFLRWLYETYGGAGA